MSLIINICIEIIFYLQDSANLMGTLREPLVRQVHTLSSSAKHRHQQSTDTNRLETAAALDNNNIKMPPPQSFDNLQPPPVREKDLPTPSSTPTTSR